MHKLLILSNLFPHDGQPNRATFNRQQFERLQNYFHTQLFVPVAWPEWFRTPRPLTSDCTTLNPQYFPYFYTPKILRHMYPDFMWWSLKPQLAAIRAWKPDVVLVSWAFPDGIVAKKLALALGIPYVMNVVGTDIYGHAAHPGRLRQILSAIDTSSGVICVSKALKEYLADLGADPQKLEVVYRGVDRDMFCIHDESGSPRSKTDKSQFLFVGNLLTTKGVFELLSAFERIAQVHENCELVFIGDGPQAHKLRRRAGPLGARVRFLGRINHAELPMHMNAATALVLPSYSEGVPNVVLEAMACGVPVVATQVGGIPEVVADDCGILVPSKSVAALEQGLMEVLREKWDREHIRDHTESFTFDSDMTGNLAVISRALDQTPAPGHGAPSQ